MTDRLKMEMMLSNLYQTKVIAASKKMDTIDAKTLADLLSEDYMA